MGEADFSQLVRLRSQLVVAAKRFGGEENLSPVVITRLSKDIDEQLELSQNMVDVVERANEEFYVTQLRYSVDKPEKTYAQFRAFVWKKEHKRFQEIVHVNYIFEEIIYLLDLMNSVNAYVYPNKAICFVL